MGARLADGGGVSNSEELNNFLVCQLVKLSAASVVRTPVVWGVTLSAPEEGQQFRMWGEGLEHPDATRAVNTSPIKEILYQRVTCDGGRALWFIETESGNHYLIVIYSDVAH